MDIIILCFLILLNGFFALSEITLVSSKKTRLKQLSMKGSKGAETALQLQGNSEFFLSAVQVGITLIGIITGVFGGTNIAYDIAPVFENISFTEFYAIEIAMTLTVLIITYISIVFGELVPKTIGLSNPEKIASFVAPIVQVFSKGFYPFVKLLSGSTNFVNKILRINKPSDRMSESEIRQIIKAAYIEGVIEKEQNVIHEKVFYFSNKKAKHIMTHRTEVEWIDLDKPPESVKKSIFKASHSTLVCSRGAIDNLQGVLHLKDYFRAQIIGKKNIEELIVQPVIVTENINALKVLEFLRQRQRHICCVVDELGGFEGIITIHDIIENILGDIPEAGVIVEPDIFVRDDKSVLVSGDAPVEILADIIEGLTIDFDQIDSPTVGGLVFHKLRKIPQVGDILDFMGYKIEIVDIDGTRIDKVLISRK